MSAQIKNPYLRFDTIRKELLERRKDIGLKKDLKLFFGDDLPGFIDFDSAPKAIISRAVLSPTMEMRFFFDLISVYKLDPLLLEYPGDFVTMNSEKLYLAKLRFFSRTRKDRIRHRVLNLVDFQRWEGSPLADIETIFGEKLVDFHHAFFNKNFPQYPIHDITKWFNIIRKKYGKFYYLGYLALGLYHGVLFENYFFRDKRETDFYLAKVQPSLIELERLFGLSPLIHPVLPLKDEDDDKWLYYRENPPQPH